MVTKTITADKGTQPIDVSTQAESDVDEMICKNFEAVNGTLKSNIKVTINIEEIK